VRASNRHYYPILVKMKSNRLGFLLLLRVWWGAGGGGGAGGCPLLLDS
jgi:hypothetical protein